MSDYITNNFLIGDLKLNTDPDCVKNHINVVQFKGVGFLDINPLLTDTRALYHVIHDMAELASKGNPDKIGAFDARGFLFGTPMALRMHRPFFPIRKVGKLPGDCEKITYTTEYSVDSIEVQKASVQPGDKVVLVDDVLATGGTMLAGIDAIEKLGGMVVGCVVLANLAFLPGQERVCEGRRPDFVKALATYDTLEDTGC